MLNFLARHESRMSAGQPAGGTSHEKAKVEDILLDCSVLKNTEQVLVRSQGRARVYELCVAGEGDLASQGLDGFNFYAIEKSIKRMTKKRSF